jgi:serine/threonine-protein kinase
VYSTGCLLYELLTGRPPFTGDSPVAVAYQHVRETPVPPSQLDGEIPPDLDAVVLKAMAKNPDNRYQTAGEMAADLDRVAAGRRVTATPVLAPEARTQQLSPATTATTVLSPVGLAAASAAARRRRRTGYITLAAAIVIVIVVAALVTKSLLSSNTKKNLQIPNVVGKTLEDAQKYITNDGFVVGKVSQQFSTTVDKDHVISQSPDPSFGSIKQGTSIDLVVSEGVEMVTVPDSIINETEAQARSDLANAGFKNGPPQLVNDLTKDPGTVVGSTPDPGTSVRKGSVVTLKVVSGKATVPSLTGMTESQATQALDDVGLLLGQSSFANVTDPKKVGKVIAQSIPAGKQVDRNTEVTVTIGQLAPSPSPSPSPTPSAAPSPSATPSTEPPTTIFPTP